MLILTLDNKPYSLDKLPEQITEDLRFAVFDNSNPQDPDYFFIPLIFLESFSSPAVNLQIGKYKINMPVDWSIVVGEPEQGELQVLPITSINERGFDAFTFNPLGSGKPNFYPVDINNVYSEVKWYFPKTKNGQLIAVPLSNEENPECAYFIKDINRQSESIDYSKAW